MTRVFALLSLVTVPAVLGSCGSATAPAPAFSAPGRYVAERFVVGTDDVLAQGGTLEVTIAADYTTTGRLAVPAAAGRPAVDESLAGRVTEDAAGGVRFRFPATDLVLEEYRFARSGARLAVDSTGAGGTRLQAVLARVP